MDKHIITHEEFEEILSTAGIDLNETGYDSIISMVMSYYFTTATEFKEKGLDYGAKDFRNTGFKIHNEMVKRGYRE